jgi:PAS domain S-box-containing protein
VPTLTAPDPIALVALEDPERVPDAVTITDEAGSIVAVNEAFTRLHGYRPEEVIGRRPSVLKSGMQSSRFYEELWRTVSAGDVWEAELVDRGADGHLRSIRSRVVPVHDGSGTLHRYVAIQREIGSPVDDLSVGHVRVDGSGRATAADARAATLLLGTGHTGEELLGPGLLGSFEDQDALALREAVDLALTRTTRHHLDLPVRTGFVRLTVTPEVAADGPWTGAVITVVPVPNR